MQGMGNTTENTVGETNIPDETAKHPAVPGEPISVTLRTLTGRAAEAEIPSEATVRDIAIAFIQHGLLHESVDLQTVRLITNGSTLEDWTLSVAECGITNGSVVHAILRLRKPVIYFISTKRIENIKVSLTPDRDWKIAATYPLSSHESPRWTVDVNPDGTLDDHDSGLTVSYLFWEALPSPSSTSVRSSLPREAVKFDPRAPFETTGHAITLTLPFETFLPYLDKTLQALSLSPAMRTDFISHWLPNLQCIRNSQRNVNFTFVHQAVFARAAKILLEGAPQCTIARIFMVFRGVPINPDWPCARQADMVKVDWVKITGHDKRGMEDSSKLRVLEWGAMAGDMI